MTNESDKTGSLKEISAPQIYRVNSFVARGCEGNPAGVCLLPAERDDRFYQNTAVKMDCSETAFLFKKAGEYHLRWFTSAGGEVDLCGHATLALSWILWDKGYANPGTAIHYNTKSGVLSATLEKDNVCLDFPVKPVAPLKKDEYPLAEILGVKVLYMGKAWFDLLVETDGADDIKNLTPDFKLLAKIPVRGIIVTAKSRSRRYDFVSRFFAPAIGIDEDPVTGSAHCALAVYWGNKLRKDAMTGYQASKEGGMVGVRVIKDRVVLSGKAREVKMSGKIKQDIGV